MIRTREQRRMGTRVAGWTLGCILAMAGAAGGSAAQAQAKNPGPATAAATHTLQRAAQVSAKPESGGGMHEGIKVHGHWTIEVRNPNGKLLSHTEFENSLYSPGTTGYPYAFLVRGYSVGEWGILLGSSSSSPCTATLNGPFNSGSQAGLFPNFGLAFNAPFCVLSEVIPPAAIEPQNCASAPDSGCSQNLQVQLLHPGGANLPVGPLSLSGSVVAANAGTISQVQTILSACGGGTSPFQCASLTSGSSTGDYLYTFTAATLPASNTTQTPCSSTGAAGQISCAVKVPEAGDTINVQVTISFQ